MLLCVCVHAKSIQLCLTLCDPLDYSLPDSSLHGILQARILEWVAMPSSRGSSQLQQGLNQHLLQETLQADSLPLNHQGSPYCVTRQFVYSYSPVDRYLTCFWLSWLAAMLPCSLLYASPGPNRQAHSQEGNRGIAGLA